MNKLNDIIFPNIYNKLDLHGQPSDIAKLAINDFIEENIKMKNEIIIIVHGIGKGILRKVTHDALKNNKNVLYFKQDNFNEGQTLVQLRSDIMAKNGFTLTEILAVIVILSLLMLIITPNLLKSIKTKSPEVEDSQKQMINEAAILFSDSYFSESSPENYEVCFRFSTLEKNGYLNQNIEDATGKALENYKNKIIKVKNTSPKTVEIVNNQCSNMID